MSDIEYRGAHGEIRGVNDSDKTFELRIVTYDTVDSYGSVWAKDVFTRSLEQKLPSAAWGHDWARIIGSLKEFDLQDDGVNGLVKFADFDDVPDARMAWSLLRDGHVKDTSFGFKRQEWADKRSDSKYTPTRAGEKEIIRVARLDEVSPVLVGAVPGSRTLAVRSEGRITRMDAGEMLVAVAAGTLSLREALNSLEDEKQAPEAKADEQKAVLAELTAVDVLNRADAEIALFEIGVEHGTRGGWSVTGDPVTDFVDYFTTGAGAYKVRWGTEGADVRASAQLRRYLSAQQAEALTSVMVATMNKGT